MKRIIVLLLLLLFVLSICGCSTVVSIEEGKYVSETPYITFTMEYGGEKPSVDEIEINQKVYKAYTFGGAGPDNSITYYECTEDIANNKFVGDYIIYADFEFQFDKENKQLILRDRKTKNVYHLDKVQ